MALSFDLNSKSIYVIQELVYYNNSQDTLKNIILNDWNNAYSSKNTPLAERFSDEFYRTFHHANSQDYGATFITNLSDQNGEKLNWSRPLEHPDLVNLSLNKPLNPGEKVEIHLSYNIKIPNDKFTGYGFSDLGEINLKNWYLTPARFENHQFVTYSNLNLDDCANAISDYEIEIRVPAHYNIKTDLDFVTKHSEATYYTDIYEGKSRMGFTLFISKKTKFQTYSDSSLNILSSIENKRVNEIQKAILIDQIMQFTKEKLGNYPFKNITVSQTDYNRNPFYGLNQLPSFLRPFTDEFVFEITFLKTFLNNYLTTTLQIDQRKDTWVVDALQIYLIMEYIDLYHPDQKMMGKLSNFFLTKNYKLARLKFNEQFSYYYMLMARKNLDQPLNESKDNLIKFNEQIASKYRAGLSLEYLNEYLGKEIVANSISQFYQLNLKQLTTADDFENILKNNSAKNIDWFFDTVINSREIIDYKFTDLQRNSTKDSVSFKVKSKTNTYVPVPVYGVKKNEILFKKWIEPNVTTIDTTYNFARNGANKIVLNYENEVPEYNLRNNWKSLRGFKLSNKPVKFTFGKDLEDPNYNQILFMPTIGYNYYDGFSPGLRFNNRTILNKPFTYDINPAYSIKAQTFSGSGNLTYNANYRNSRLYNAKYWISGSYFHYIEDATYLKINPSVFLSIREKDFRDNQKQHILIRQTIVNREKSALVTDNSNPNYSVFNARYYHTKTEIAQHLNIVPEIQFSKDFGKFATEIEYRKLFQNKRQLNLRLYFGTFIYNHTDTDYFSFAVDRPTDYLFDYGYYGRSESTGFFSQQFIMAEGGFKSKLNTPYANQWISSLNASYAIWNWIELYTDFGLMKNRSVKTQFMYDNGIRLNLVPDYFELYFPISSNLGWEISQPHYYEKIRFVVTFSPKTLTNLFTRKWF
ncbi:gluzincin family metallopeptidase [Flavobacterium agrisoli]|uniref:Aminopeptidase n=1 Tax=Flavobacterium agrisoli TaxID=2793066 RepID=A0A934PKQ6_9FLAO|nr:aminopeptidase [Flavobacterium agrisoli]MBK0368540.1 aminopeptidase [Flavobacterium agrisoli]